MKKIFKKLIAAAMAGVMAVSGLCVGASAAFYEQRSEYGTFSGDTYYCQTTNLTNADKYLTAFISARDRYDVQGGYSQKTGVGGYAYKVRTDIDKDKYPLNLYYYVCTGSIYKGAHYNSGIQWTGVQTIK